MLDQPTFISLPLQHCCGYAAATPATHPHQQGICCNATDIPPTHPLPLVLVQLLVLQQHCCGLCCSHSRHPPSSARHLQLLVRVETMTGDRGVIYLSLEGPHTHVRISAVGG